jgi:hypothetical protein
VRRSRPPRYLANRSIAEVSGFRESLQQTSEVIALAAVGVNQCVPPKSPDHVESLNPEFRGRAACSIMTDLRRLLQGSRVS